MQKLCELVGLRTCFHSDQVNLVFDGDTPLAQTVPGLLNSLPVLLGMEMRPSYLSKPLLFLSIAYLDSWLNVLL